MGDGRGLGSVEAVAMSKARLLAWHNRFTRFEPASELSRLNADPRPTVPASAVMRRFIRAAVVAASQTGGLVDATLLDEVQDAGYGKDLRASLPLPLALRLAPPRRPAGPRPATRWGEISVDDGRGSVTRPPGVRFDSGGLAKGLFADLLARELRAHPCFALDCAGDLRMGGRAGMDRAVEVASPFDGSVLHTFSVRDAGVATSGIGKRSWLDANGTPGHHLLDPGTGRPAYTGIVQATALAPSALEAEIRAKAAILSGPAAAGLGCPTAARWSSTTAAARSSRPLSVSGPSMPDQPAEHRLLVVDDERSLLELVTMALRFQGFAVETATTGRAALAAVPVFKPHLIVLDVMLPDMEGFEVAQRLGAQRSDVPIIFLTARDATEDKVRGLSSGGDDYMTKPFSLEELVARIRTILRRSAHSAPRAAVVVFEDLELDEVAREVTQAGAPVPLTATEYRLLRCLMLNPRRVMTRSQLLDHVWDYDFGGDGRVLETYISYLRKKLDADGRALIRTVRGVGYALQAPRPG